MPGVFVRLWVVIFFGLFGLVIVCWLFLFCLFLFGNSLSFVCFMVCVFVLFFYFFSFVR